VGKSLIRVKNSKAVSQELVNYGKRSAKGILKELQITGLKVETKAKVRVPIDTGRLRSSIATKTRKENVTVSTNVEYAPFVELGTSRMSARPYLFNSYKEELPRLIKRIKQILKKSDAR
jgi:phage gpG-like protein